MTCNLRHAMGLGHPVITCISCSHSILASNYLMPSHAHTHTHTHTHTIFFVLLYGIGYFDAAMHLEYEVATISRLLKIIGLFRKKTL